MKKPENYLGDQTALRPYVVLILNRYPEFANRFIQSIRRTHSRKTPILVVCDRHKETLDAQQIYAPEPFSFAKNANLGISAIEKADIILCNDDLECVEEEFFERLSSIAWKFPRAGIVSPLIDGGVGNSMQQWPPTNAWRTLPEEICMAGCGPTSIPVCFPCVYLKRKMIDSIGLFDETFVNYGFEDNDLCIRARRAGWWTMTTKRLRIKHGSGGTELERGKNWSCSFAVEEKMTDNQQIFMKKYLQEK
jgi:hypothetical protein